jgi:hypothetical protein
VPTLRKLFIQVLRVMSKKGTGANTAGENAQPPDALPAPERKASVQTLGHGTVSIYTEASAGSEESIVWYERPTKTPRRVGEGATFYEEETIDEP